MYEYKVTPIRVLDGDTAQFSIDLGLNVHKTEILRFYGIDTPETNSSDPATRARAKQAKDFVSRILVGEPEASIVCAVAASIGHLSNVEPLDQDKLRALVAQFFPRIATEVKVQTAKPYSQDKYGRWLGTVFYKTATSDPVQPWINLNESLVALGLATAYFGGAK